MCRFFKDSQDSAEAAKRAEIVKIVEDYDDIQAENVLELVRSSKGNYIVFIDSDLEIDWETTDHYDGEHKDDTFTKQRNHILQRLNELQYTPAVKQLRQDKRKCFQFLLGEALAISLDGNYDEAERMLDRADAYLKERVRELSRSWQLLGTFVLTAVLFPLFRFAFPQYWLLFYSCLGAFFSILTKAGKIDYNCAAGRFLFYQELAARFIAALISALIVTKLFELDLIFTAFKSLQYPETAQALVCFVSGFSERLVPSIIEKFGKAEEASST